MSLKKIVIKHHRTKELYVLQHGYVGNCMQFYGKPGFSYTTEFQNAAVMNEDEAKSFIKGCPDKDFVAWPLHYIRRRIGTTVDMQFCNILFSTKFE